MQQVRWAALLETGELLRGDGDQPGLNREVLPRARAAVVGLQGFPLIVVAGPIRLRWLNDVVACASSGRELGRKRWWGFDVTPPDRLWFWPDGSRIGIGPTVDDVDRAFSELQGHLGLRLGG